MSIKSKVITVISLCLLAGAIALVMFIDRSYRDNVGLISQQALSSAQKSFDSVKQNDIKMLKAVVTTVSDNSEIRSIFMAGQREKLIERLSPLYKELRSSCNITQWLMMEPEPSKKVFLRMQMPEQFGDVRKVGIFEKSVKTKQSTTGFDLAKYGFALRVVAPYYDNKNAVIGYMELGERVNRFMGVLKSQTGDDYGLVVKKQYMDKDTYIAGQKNAGEVNHWDDQKDTLVLDRTSDDPILLQYDGDITKIPESGMILGQVLIEGKSYVRGVFPLKDAIDRVIGAVFVLRDITQVYNGMKTVKTSSVVAIVVLVLVLSCIMILSLNKLVFSRLAKTMDVAISVVGGDFDRQIVPASKDEVGKLEELLEQFRTVFVNTVKDLQDENQRVSKGK
jgi:hypothetical protein